MEEIFAFLHIDTTFAACISPIMALSSRLHQYEEPLFVCSIHAVECDGKHFERDMKRAALTYYGREWVEELLIILAFHTIRSMYYVFQRKKISVSSLLMIVCYVMLCCVVLRAWDNGVDVPKRLFLVSPETKPIAFLHLKVEMYIFHNTSVLRIDL